MFEYSLAPEQTNISTRFKKTGKTELYIWIVKRVLHFKFNLYPNTLRMNFHLTLHKYLILCRTIPTIHYGTINDLTEYRNRKSWRKRPQSKHGLKQPFRRQKYRQEGQLTWKIVIKTHTTQYSQYKWQE